MKQSTQDNNNSRSKRIRLMVLSVTGILALSGCTVTPHANLGLDLNYYNGSFHVEPTAHVGVYGRPRY